MNGAPPPGTIRKDDLEALGDLAQYVGGGLTDIVQSTTSGDRRNLFKNGNPDPRYLFTKALGNDGRNAPRRQAPGQPLPPPPPLVEMPGAPQPPRSTSNEPSIPHSALPLTNEQLMQLMAETQPEENEIPQYPPTPTGGWPDTIPAKKPILVPKPQDEQMEFSFVNQVIQHYGSVGDIIRHFDDRLDNIETSIKLINSFMTEARETMKFVKANMQRKRSQVGPQ